jgi:steroid 5-alpha reductase family enzyme
MARTHTVSSNLLKAFSLCLLAYVLALAAATIVGHTLHDLHPILIAFWADIAATLVIYLFIREFKNSSFYDPYWSVAPLVIVVYWAIATMPASGIGVRQIVIISLVFIWGLGLTFNWARQWRGLLHEDWRYAEYRKRYQGWFWLIDLVGIELLPTSIVFLGCLSMYPVLAGGGPFFSILDIVAILVTLGAILIEATADEQLKKFYGKTIKPAKLCSGVLWAYSRHPNYFGEIMQRGLWAYSRHPNYFGEILFWWGLYLFVLSADIRFWWTIIRPLVITLLFMVLLFMVVSIPLMDKRNLARRPGYAEHMKKVSALIPWFPKN